MPRHALPLILLTIPLVLAGGPWALGRTAGNPPPSSVRKSLLGTMPDGRAVDLFTLTNAHGLTAKIITYGATLTELHAPDQNGHLDDIVLGFDNLAQYLGEHPYFGATVGRVANRIARGHFTLDGKEYSLAVNNPPNHLHGGIRGFNRVLWQADPLPGRSGTGVRLAYTSPEGEEGYPGRLSVTVVYTLTGRDELRIEYTARADRATPVNLTHHSYFNLAGSGDILGHELMLAADRFTPVDDTLIPTGEIRPVKGTPMDFTRPARIGGRIGELSGNPGGYDHNYVLRHTGKKPALAARVREPGSGRVLELYTTEPGVQFYTGNFLDGSLAGKNGTLYRKHAGFCLEAQHFPDSPNHPDFPSIVIRPGQTYRQVTVYRFKTE